MNDLVVKDFLEFFSDILVTYRDILRDFLEVFECLLEVTSLNLLSDFFESFEWLPGIFLDDFLESFWMTTWNLFNEFLESFWMTWNLFEWLFRIFIFSDFLNFFWMTYGIPWITSWLISWTSLDFLGLTYGFQFHVFFFLYLIPVTRCKFIWNSINMPWPRLASFSAASSCVQMRCLCSF